MNLNNNEQKDWILLTQRKLSQRLNEPREIDCVPLKRAARYLLGKPKASMRYRRQKHVDNFTVFVDSDFVGDPVSRKSTTRLVAQIGNHTVKSGSTLQSLTAMSVGEAEFFAVVKGGQVRLSLRSMYQDLGIPTKIEIKSDSSTANSLTDRLRAGQRTKHIVTWYFWIQERVQGRDLSIKKVPTAKICADVGTKPVSASDGSHTPLQDEGDEPMMDLVTVQTRRHEHRHIELSVLIVDIETDV